MMGMFSDADSMMTALGMTTPFSAALIVMAIGAGSVIVSHANDSFFWVVSNFSGLTPQDGYKTHSVMTLIVGVTSILAVFALSLVL